MRIESGQITVPSRENRIFRPTNSNRPEQNLGSSSRTGQSISNRSGPSSTPVAGTNYGRPAPIQQRGSARNNAGDRRRPLPPAAKLDGSGMGRNVTDDNKPGMNNQRGVYQPHFSQREDYYNSSRQRWHEENEKRRKIEARQANVVSGRLEDRITMAKQRRFPSPPPYWSLEPTTKTNPAKPGAKKSYDVVLERLTRIRGSRGSWRETMWATSMRK